MLLVNLDKSLTVHLPLIIQIFFQLGQPRKLHSAADEDE